MSAFTEDLQQFSIYYPDFVNTKQQTLEFTFIHEYNAHIPNHGRRKFRSHHLRARR